MSNIQQDRVYNTTTVAERSSSDKWIMVPSVHLNKPRFIVKILEVLLSFVAFVLEEVVNNCTNCGALYFFEFVSCTAFLFTFLLLVLLATTLHQRVGISCWPSLDFGYTAVLFILFLIASFVFTKNEGSSLEAATVVFGFLATAAFLVDLFLFVKFNGLPWKGGDKAPVQTSTQPGPEGEKLNTNGTS